MNPGSRDTPTDEKTQRLSSGDGHGHSKSGGSIAMHDHGRHSPASAHSPGVSGKLPGLHPDSSRSSRGFGTPNFSTTGLPGFNLEHHIPFFINSASSLIFPPFIHPSTGSLFPPVLPPNFLPPPLQPPLTSLFPSPNAECEVSSSGWSALSGGSRNTSSLGSSSSEGDVAAKIDSRTVRSSRCSPDVNLQPSSLPSNVRKIWESSVVDPVIISDADMPLSLVTRRETTSRGSSTAESGVCTGDSVARAASTEASRTPSLDGENGCHPVGESSSVQEQTVAADQPSLWPAAKVNTDSLPAADDGKSLVNEDIRSSSTAASRSSGIALPPRKRLTRNAEELQSSGTDLPAESLGAANSPSSAPNFRSCWKKFAAKSNISGPTSHRAFVGKPQYDCRTYFQKLAEQARAAAASKAFVPGKGKGHCYRNANKTSPRSSDQNTGSPRVTRSQSKPKKSQSPKSSPSEPPAPVRKSTRKKSINTRFDEYDRTIGKNKKSKGMPDSNAAASGVEKEASQTAGDDEVTPGTESSSQRKKSRRGKVSKGESATDADMSSVCADGEDSTSQSQFPSDAAQLVSEADSKQNNTTSSIPAAADEGSDINARTEDTIEEPSASITVLPPKFRHFKIKTAAAALESSQLPSSAERPIAAVGESGNSEVAASVKVDNTDAAVSAAQSDGVATEEEARSKYSSVENSMLTESSGSTLAMEEQPKVSQSHSVGGRKSLLYRSSAIAAADSQPSTELKRTPVFSQSEFSLTAEAVNDTSVDLKSANDDVSATEHNKVSSEQSEVLDNTVAEALLSDSSEKTQSGTDEVHVEQPVEAESSKSSDTISPCPSITDMDLSTSTTVTDTSNTTSNNASVITDKESVQPSEHDSGTVNVDDVAQRLPALTELPAGTSDKSDSQNGLQPTEGSDALVKSSSQSLESQQSELPSTGVASKSSAESRLCTTPVTAVSQTTSISCRTKPVDVTGGMDEESVSQNGDSRKRILPDETINDDAKRRRVVSSVEHSTDSVDIASELADTTPEINTADNLVLSGDSDSVPSTVTSGQLHTALSASTGIQSNSKPERLKPNRTNTPKTNHKLKPNRALKTTDVEPPLLEKSNNLTAETRPAESEAAKVGEKFEPPLLYNLVDSNNDVTAVVKYAVVNSVDRVCDINTDTSSVQSEQKTLRISLVAINESVLSSATAHRAKDSTTESNSDKLSNTSAAVPVCTTTAASVVVNNLKQLTSNSLVADAEPSVASTGSVVSQDAVALEHDSSALLSQCRSLSVVIKKMQNENSSTSPPAASPKPTGRRRKHGLAHRRISHSTKPEVPVEESLLSAKKPAVEPSPVDNDEYKFTDDTLADSLPPQRTPRPERKVTSRKVRNSLPTSSQVDLSLAATSDSNSRDAASTVDSSSIASGSTEVTPNTVPKVPSKPETGSGRSRRRKPNLLEDEDTRSLSPFSQSLNSPVPVVEASLDGHKLKLRIINRSAEVSTFGDAKLSVPSSSSVELTDSKTNLQLDEVQVPDEEPLPSTTEVPPPPEPVSRRRQLKVEGVRSRFLTLHKPSVAPLADHVKCRLVKVGRRQWMSVGGEDADDADSDVEIPTSISPVPVSIDEMPQNPTRDRLLLVTDNTKPHRRRGRPPKAKTNLEDPNSSAASVKRTKKKAKTDVSSLEVSFSKPEPPPEVVSRPTRVDPVPWLDCEAENSETRPYSALVDSSSRTIATDIEEYRSCVSTPIEFVSNIDLMISDALTDSSVELAYSTVRTPKSMFFIQSELERLMEDLVLDDRFRRPRIHSPPLSVARETHIPVQRSAGVARTFSHSNGIFSPVLSPRNDQEVDLLLSQPSVRLRNCTLPVDANDSSDYDCAVVGYDHPTYCYPDFVDLPTLSDQQLVDADYSLPSVCLTDPQFYGSVDFVL